MDETAALMGLGLGVVLTLLALVALCQFSPLTAFSLVAILSPPPPW